MTSNDQKIILDYLAGVAPKEILQDSEIKASRGEIQAFLDEVHSHLRCRYRLDGLNEDCMNHGCDFCGGSGQVLDSIPLVERCPGKDAPTKLRF